MVNHSAATQHASDSAQTVDFLADQRCQQQAWSALLWWDTCEGTHLVSKVPTSDGRAVTKQVGWIFAK